MRFLFISRRGASLSLATRIVSEGHKVNFFVNNLNYKILGNGIVEKTKIGEAYNCDVVIFDEAGMGEYASKMAKSKPVIGSSIFADTFNNNISYKKKVLDKCGIQLSANSGIELHTTAWFNGFSFVAPYHSYFKKTKFMEHEMGLDTESAGCLLWYHKSNKITKAFLTPLLKELKKTGYVGAVNITVNINADNFTLANICLGFLFDSTYAALEGLRQPLGEFLYRLAFEGIKRVKASGDFLVATRVSIPPYPFKMQEQLSKQTPIGGISEANLKHLWLRDILKDEEGNYYSAGCDGYILTVSARGLTPQKAFRRTYRTISNLTIENLQYRSDLCDNLEDKYRELKRLGYF